MTVEYLLIDDLGRNSRKFKETVSLPGRLEFVIIDDLEMLQDVPRGTGKVRRSDR